jgi:outer membrane protein TolC
LADLERHALEHHPELRRLEEQVAAESANVTLAQKAFLPDLRLMASYNSLWDEADKRPIVGLSINVPLDRRKRRAALSSARAYQHRAELRLAQHRARLLAELVRARAEVTESIQTVELVEKSLLPLVSEYLDSTVADYRSGAGGFLAVIDAEHRKFVVEENLARHHADYFARVAALERWTGIPLESVSHAATEVHHDHD